MGQPGENMGLPGLLDLTPYIDQQNVKLDEIFIPAGLSRSSGWMGVIWTAVNFVAVSTGTRSFRKAGLGQAPPRMPTSWQNNPAS
jgi:hypothetical protein